MTSLFYCYAGVSALCFTDTIIPYGFRALKCKASLPDMTFVIFARVPIKTVFILEIVLIKRNVTMNIYTYIKEERHYERYEENTTDHLSCGRLDDIKPVLLQ